MKRIAIFLALAVVTAFTAACGGDDSSSGAAGTTAAIAEETTATETTAAEMNIVETAVAAGDFTTLASLLEQAGLVETLSTDGPFTVFAPTDEAFAKVPQATLDSLAADTEQLKAVLLYHVVPGSVSSSEVANLSSAETLNGATVAIEVTDGSVKINDATVTTADIEASNGVIHVVDTVLIPS